MNDLVGSEKQISWASKIRMEQLNGLLTSGNLNSLSEVKEWLNGKRERFSRNNRIITVQDAVLALTIAKEAGQIKSFLESQTDAKFWIDNREVTKKDWVKIATQQGIIEEDEDCETQFFLEGLSKEELKVWAESQEL